MARRVTVVGKAYWCGDREYALREIHESIERNAGNVSRMASELDLSRCHLYRIIWHANLWPVIDAAREAWVDRRNAATDDWLNQTRRHLK